MTALIRRWRAASLLLALLVALALPVGAQDSGGGSWMERQLSSLVPGLRLEGLQNPLSSRPSFTRLTLSDAQGVWLEVLDGSMDWTRLALLRRRVEISELTAARLVLRRLPESDTPTPDPAPTGLLPELPSLPVDIRIDRLRITRAEIDEAVAGRALALGVNGSIRLDSGGLDLGLDVALIDGGAVLVAQAALRPSTGRLQANATLRGDPGGALSRIAGLGERPLNLELVLDGPAENAALSLDVAAGEGVALRIAGTVQAPDAARLGLDVTGSVDATGLAPPQFSALAGPWQMALATTRAADGVFDLRRLSLTGVPGSIEASGRADLEGDRSALRVRAALANASTLAALLPGDLVGWDSLVLEGDVAGALAAPRVAVQVAPEAFRSSIPQVAALLGGQPRATLRAALPDRVEELALTGQALTARASGRVGETLDLAFSAEVAAPEAAVPGLAGALRLAGTAQGAASDPTLALTVDSPRLEAGGIAVEALALRAEIVTPASRPAVTAEGSGRVQDLPLALSVRGTPEDAGWLRLEAAEASFGPARLTARGRLNPSALLADGEARLEARDLAPFARLLGQPLAGGLTLEARGTPRDGRQTLTVRLDAPRLDVAGVAARGLTASAEGSLDALDLAVSGTVNDVVAEARGRLAQLPDGARRLELAALRATASGETLRLAAPTTVTLRPDGSVAIADTRIALRSGTLRAEGTWGPERADIRASLAALDLAAFAALAPQLGPSGTVTGEARVTGTTAAPEITATLRGTRLRSTVEAARGLPPGEAKLDLRRTAEGLLTASAEARIGTQQRLNATARFPRGPAADAPFEATLDGALDLGLLSAPLLAAGADRVTGRMTLALRASGTPNAPQFGGEARLAGGAYRNGVLGIAYSDLAGTLRPEGPRLRVDIAGRTPENGRLRIAGTIEPLTAGLPADLTLTATNARVVSSALAQATMDAELRLIGAALRDARLAGTVRVQRVEIRVPERLGSGVRTLEPVIERGTPPNGAPRATPVNAPPPSTAGLPPIVLAIEISAPRNVFVRGRGLDVELGGTLNVTGTLNAPSINGALDMRRGDVTVIGRRITFERGRLAWYGGIMPDLALRASSQAGQVTARLDITGPPTSPELVFSSTPELPPDEVAARLLFDRPLRDLSPFEIAQIAYALAGATGLPGGDVAGSFLGRVRDTLGLDRLAVGGGGENAGRDTSREDRSGATLEAGRYVADGVYVGAKQGTQPGSSSVGVRVDLTPRLRLEAETGDREAGSRVGLNYEWQWGR
jgi:translocation and assembly module TamB